MKDYELIRYMENHGHISDEVKDIVIGLVKQRKEITDELNFLRNWKAGVTNDFLKYDAESVEEIAEKARKKGIVEFANRLKGLIRINAKVTDRFLDCHCEVYESDVDEIAEELKGGVDIEN